MMEKFTCLKESGCFKRTGGSINEKKVSSLFFLVFVAVMTVFPRGGMETRIRNKLAKDNIAVIFLELWARDYVVINKDIVIYTYGPRLIEVNMQTGVSKIIKDLDRENEKDIAGFFDLTYDKNANAIQMIIQKRNSGGTPPVLLYSWGIFRLDDCTFEEVYEFGNDVAYYHADSLAGLVYIVGGFLSSIISVFDLNTHECVRKITVPQRVTMIHCIYGQPPKMIFSNEQRHAITYYVFNLETEEVTAFPKPVNSGTSAFYKRGYVPYNSSDNLFLVFENNDLVLLNLAESTVVTLKSFERPVRNLTREEDGKYSFLMEWNDPSKNILFSKSMLLCFMEYP
jgi:hypothetical protein